MFTGLALLLVTSSFSPSAAGVHPAPLVHATDIELVKKRAESTGGGGDRSFFTYLLDVVTMKPQRTHAAIEKSLVNAWVLGSLLSAFGGHIWVPGLFFKNVPENAPAKQALIIGIVGTVIPWLLMINVILHAITTGWWWIPGLGWVGGTIVQVGLLLFDVAMIVFVSLMTFWIVPRAMYTAYSDAYGSGGGRAKPRVRKKEPEKDSSDEDAEY